MRVQAAVLFVICSTLHGAGARAETENLGGTQTPSLQRSVKAGRESSDGVGLRQQEALRCRTITYTATSVCPTHTVRQCASAKQPSTTPQTSYEIDMCHIAAAKACSQIGSSFSSATDDCTQFGCVNAPDTCDVDADCSVAAQEVPCLAWFIEKEPCL